jgi:hypothetical protein
MFHRCLWYNLSRVRNNPITQIWTYMVRHAKPSSQSCH